MNPLEFIDLAEISGLLNPSELDIEAIDIEGCSHRYDVVQNDALANDTARCAFLIDIAGGDIGIDRRTCQICRCHGAADRNANRYLQRHIVCLAWGHTIAPQAAMTPFHPDDAEVFTAVDNVKRIRGTDIARRFVDTLVYHQSVTPEKGADILNEHGLAEVG